MQLTCSMFILCYSSNVLWFAQAQELETSLTAGKYQGLRVLTGKMNPLFINV